MDQADPNQTRLQTVNSQMLTPIVQKALNQPTVTLTNWDYQQVHGGFGGGGSATFIYRFKGNALVQDDPIQWSLILKIIHAQPNDTPDSTHYWKREFEVYRFGLLTNLPGRLVAAKSYQTVEYPDEACWIWQEDIQGEFIDPWQLEHYEHISRHFGQFNGAYMTSHTLPDQPWLSRQWLRKIAELVEPLVPNIEAFLSHPTLQPAFPTDAKDVFLKLWVEHERFLSALDKLPQTFAHQDPVRRNLFLRRGADGGYETVAIDWAYVGQAAVGMDIAVPLVINLAFMWDDIATVKEFEEFLYNGYLNGLRDAGWDGDERQVRLGFTAATVCKYLEGLYRMAKGGYLIDPIMQPNFEAMLGFPIKDIIEQQGGLFRHVFQLAEEARQIMDELDYS